MLFYFPELFQRGLLFRGHVLHGQVDAAHLVDLKDLDVYFVADLQLVFDLLDAALGDLGDMHAAFLAGHQLHERAARDDGHDAALEDLAGFDVVHDALDDADRFLDHGHIGAGHRDGAVILDIDLHAGILDDLVDDLALLADDVADLGRIDRDGDDLRSPLADLRTRLGDRLAHDFVHDIDAGGAGAGDGFADDVVR